MLVVAVALAVVLGATYPKDCEALRLGESLGVMVTESEGDSDTDCELVPSADATTPAVLETVVALAVNEDDTPGDVEALAVGVGEFVVVCEADSVGV